MPLEVKVCGIKDKAAIAAAVADEASYIGFVFYSRSPRNISLEKAASLQKFISDNIKIVAVTVDPDDVFLHELINSDFNPDYLQLHGNESVSRVKEIKSKYNIKIIKAFKVSNSDDIAKSKQYQNIVNMLLFDARANKQSELPGGNGLTFDWNLLKHHNFNVPWILSGGLNKDNLAEAVSSTKARIIDASSSLEVKAGVKDPMLIKDFLQVAKVL